MCTRVTCPTCNRPTYKGCGAHVEQVLRGVPESDRCDCAKDGGTGSRFSLSSLLGKRR